MEKEVYKMEIDERVSDLEEAVRYFKRDLEAQELERAVEWLEDINVTCEFIKDYTEKMMWKAGEYGKDGMKKAFVGEKIPFYDNSKSCRSDSKIVSWDWFFGDGQTSKDRNPIHIYETPGTYKVILIATDDLCGGRIPITKEIEILPR